MHWNYAKLDENGKVIHCPTNDLDGKITGKVVLGLKYWFDENPEERKRLGWIKVITPSREDVKYDHQTQVLTASYRQIDEYTVELVYHVMNKSEEQMRLEEMLTGVELDEGIVFKIGGLEFGA